MAVKIRLARAGAKKRPYYKIVAANNTAPRDGDFLEKLGTYNPLLKDDNGQRVTLKPDRIEYWLNHGAKPTERVAIFLDKAGIPLPAAVRKEMEIKVKSQTHKASKKQIAEAK